MYSLTNGKTDTPSDHVMEIDLWFVEGTIFGCSLFSPSITVPTRAIKYCIVPCCTLLNDNQNKCLGYKDIGLKSITQEYANQVRRRHWILCGVDTLSLILASYLIIKKSKKEMRAFKWFLLNIAVRPYL